MYGAYAHTDENEEETASGSFSLASLVGSSKKYKRRLGCSDRGRATTFGRPVRMGQDSAVKTGPNIPRRNMGTGNVELSDLRRKLDEIAEENNDDHNINRDCLSQSLKLESVAEADENFPGKENVVPGIGAEKSSPDSGSFTMTHQDTLNIDPKASPLADHVQIQSVDHQGSLRKPENVSYRGCYGVPVRTRLKAVKPHNENSNSKINEAHENLDAYAEHDSIVHRSSKCNQVPSRLPEDGKFKQENVQPGATEQSEINPSTEGHKSVPNIVNVTPMPSKAKFSSYSETKLIPPPSKPKSGKTELHLIVRGKSYRVIKLLGKGGSSRVYEALSEEENIVVAIKRVDLSEADETQTSGYLNEIELLSRLQGEDRIVKLHDHEKVYDEKENSLYVIMEKGDTDLASLLKKYANKRELTPAMIKHYWTEMLHAVSAIHQKGIIHKDLKPANFLLVEGRLKLIDFGIASSIQSDKTSILIDNQMGTFNYMSPESIEDLSGPHDMKGNLKPCIKISYKTDVWSLGCILYQLAYGKLPFGDIKHPLMKIKAITDSNHAIPYPSFPDEDKILTSLIKDCLVRDPKSRPSVLDLLNHRYITGVEIASVRNEPQLDHLIVLDALEGVLSPRTFSRNKELISAKAAEIRNKMLRDHND